MSGVEYFFNLHFPIGTPEDLEKYIIKSGDVLIGMDGSKVGYNRVYVRDVDLPLILAQRVARLRVKETMTQNFLYYIVY